MSEISDLALQGDRLAILKARAHGPAAVPELLELGRHSDGQVREIALYGLDEFDDPRATQLFVSSLMDAEPMVRGIAMRALHRRPDPGVRNRLLDVLERSPEPVVRHNVALMLGRIGPPLVDPSALRRRLGVETDPFAQEGLIVALAKLGDDTAQQRYVDMLHASRERVRLRMLEHARYIGNRWLLPALVPLLDDTTPAIRIGVDGLLGPEYLRVCDVTANLVAELLVRRFTFMTGRPINYSQGALSEVREAIVGV